MRRGPDGAAATEALVFGGLGAIGTAIARKLEITGSSVMATARSAGSGALVVDPFAPGGAGLDQLHGLAPLDVVVWAQGANTNDSLLDLDLDSHLEVLKANCVFISATLSHLLRHDLVLDGARLCVVSSIWQGLARQDKYSYTVSKAAVAGVVHAASVDLAPRGILVNAVLPGVVDTPMTRGVLSGEQLHRFESATGFGRLVTLEEVAGLVAHLCSPANTGVTGQSIAVDLGYSVGRLV